MNSQGCWNRRHGDSVRCADRTKCAGGTPYLASPRPGGGVRAVSSKRFPCVRSRRTHRSSSARGRSAVNPGALVDTSGTGPIVGCGLGTVVGADHRGRTIVPVSPLSHPEWDRSRFRFHRPWSGQPHSRLIFTTRSVHRQTDITSPSERRHPSSCWTKLLHEAARAAVRAGQ